MDVSYRCSTAFVPFTPLTSLCRKSLTSSTQTTRRRTPSPCVPNRQTINSPLPLFVAPTCSQPETQRTEAVPPTAGLVIKKFWSLAETGSFTDTCMLFSEHAVYNDTLYKHPFTGLPQISKHLSDMETAIPPGLVFILDDLAAGDLRVGARWHVETASGSIIPFSRGASMYSLQPQQASDGSTRLLIVEAWDFVETPFKVASLVLPALRATANLLRWLQPSTNKTH